MTKIEQYIYDWIKKNLGLLCVIAVTAIRLCAYSARTAHPFQRNGAPFRFRLSKAQQVY